MIEWGERRFAGQDFVGLIDHGNLASIRLAEKFGFRKEIDTAYHGTPLGIYRRPAGRE
jgi:RimJ/RimL family protein N-acetyltransferase